MISENKQPLDKHDKNAEPITTSQPYTSAGTSIGAGLDRDENGPTITRQPEARSPGSMSTGLARALMGGLIGVTLGTLAGALANKRTAKGVNHVVKGVGDGVKTVGEGVNHAAKSVAEGVNYAVIGAVVDAVKDTAEDAKQAIAGAVDAVEDTAKDTKRSDNQSFKLYEDQLVAGNKQVTTGEVGIGELETQTEISVPLEKRLVEPIPVDAGTPVAPVEADFQVGDSFPEG